MLENLSSALFSVFSRPDLQKNNVVVAQTATAKAQATPSKFDKEVKALEEKYGSMLNCTITVELQELNTIAPRHRVRIDAYQGLKSYLQKTRGVELIITSRKSK